VAQRVVAERVKKPKRPSPATVSATPVISALHYMPQVFENMARPARLERATLCLEGRCSIQLSYGRVPALLDASLPAFGTIHHPCFFCRCKFYEQRNSRRSESIGGLESGHTFARDRRTSISNRPGVARNLAREGGRAPVLAVPRAFGEFHGLTRDKF
jgi:hypothetical protein